MPEPVSLAEARAQVNIIDDADTTYDTFLTGLIAPARAYVERESRFFWVASARTEVFSSWGDFRPCSFFRSRSQSQYLEIYRSPIESVGPDITYTDESGADATYSAFLAPIDQFPLRIYPAIDGAFPTLGRGGRISVPYVSGALADTSEEYLIGKRAMLLLIGHWFANRESVVADTRAVAIEVPQTVTDLIDTLRPLPAY